MLGTASIWMLGASFALGLATSRASASSPVAPTHPQGGGLWYLTTDQSNYRVDPLNGSFRVRIVLAPVPGAGLLSYGVTLKFDADAFDLDRPGIEIPAGLNFNGFAGPGALTDSGPGFVSVKGTVDLLGQAIVRYDAPLIVSIILAPRDALPGESSVLTLEPYFTAGPAESLFVDGEGQVLDAELVFGSARVEFVPEPSTPALLGLGAALLCLQRRPARATPPRTPVQPRRSPR